MRKEESSAKRIFNNIESFISNINNNFENLIEIEEHLRQLNKTDVKNNEYSETFKKFFENPRYITLSTASLVYLFVNKNRYPQTCKIANAYIKDITKYLTSENRRAIKRLYLLKFKTHGDKKLNTNEKLLLENRLSLSYVFALITYATRNIINFVRGAKINNATNRNMYAANKPKLTPATVNNDAVNHKKPNNNKELINTEPDKQTEDKEVEIRKGPRI